MLNEISGVGHTVAFPTYPSEMMECINFIESQYDVTSVSENSNIENDQVTIFPNPASETIRIEISESLQFSKVQLMDSTGKLIMVFDSFEESIDVSQLADGVYNLVFVGEKELSKQFVVQH